MSKSSKLFRSFGILTMGVLITIGGIYIWNNNFDVNLFSNAGTQKVSSIIVVGDSNINNNMEFISNIESQLETEYGRDISIYEGFSDTLTLPLKDQLVTAYQQMPQPIEGKVIFVLLTGQENIKKGLKSNYSAQAISDSIREEIEDMLALPENRPGVFPDGYSIYVTDIYDTSDGLVNSLVCKDYYQYHSASESEAIRNEINTMFVDLDTSLSDRLHVVNVHDKFIGHAAGAATENLMWLEECEKLTETGKEKLANLFVEEIKKNEK